MTSTKSPTKMAATRIQEIPFTDRIEMREIVLAWISSDTGLCEFLVPDALAESWSPEQKQTWTNVIVDNFLKATNTDLGKVARVRVMAREQAGSLRRGCDKMRQGNATYRDIAKMGVTIEGLWNDIGPDLDDPTWARCSLLFDTALIALRVAYLWLYDKTENTGATVETRRKVFKTLVDSFFSANAPTDDKDDKHSANFRDLLGVWRTELQKYIEADDFDVKLDRLEETQPLLEVAAGIERFLNAIDIDKSWLWRMKLIDDELQNGHIIRKRRKKGRKKKPVEPLEEPLEVQDAPPEPPEPDSSSFEPAVPDSDFDVDDAVVKEEDEEEDDEGDDDYDSSDMVDDLDRGMMSQRRENGSIVRRSLRVAQAGSKQKRLSRPPLRLGDSPPRQRTLARVGETRKRRRIGSPVDDALDIADDEPQRASESPKLQPGGEGEVGPAKTAGAAAEKSLGETPGRLRKGKKASNLRRTGRALRRVIAFEDGSDADDENGEGDGGQGVDESSEPSLSVADPRHSSQRGSQELAWDARRKRLWAALTS